MVLIKLDHGSSIPMYLQIVNQIRTFIEKDILKKEEKLPSYRNLADQLGVHRSTVFNAYQELWALGYIDSRPGSYSIVRQKRKIVTNDKKGNSSILNWDTCSTSQAKDIYRDNLNFVPEIKTPDGSDIINFSRLSLDPRLFPIGDFKQSMNRSLLKEGSNTLGYGDYAGFEPLRDVIAKRMQRHSIAVSKDEILITSGAQNALDLLLKFFVRPKENVLIESPSYATFIPLLKFYGAEIHEIPLTDNGLDLKVAEEKIKNLQPSFIYTIPNFHNPTGITTNQIHREMLISLCEKHSIPIIEDGFEEEMKYFGKVPLPLKSIDKSNIVIYLGTFSKILFPGIRIGWICANRELIKRLLAIKRFSDITSNLIAQAALTDFCRSGYYDKHVKKMHRVFKRRMRLILELLAKHFNSKKVSFTFPQGGYLLWLTFKKPKNTEREIFDIFKKAGVLLSPGRFYFASENKNIYFRISISATNEEEIFKGIKRMQKAFKKIY